MVSGKIRYIGSAKRGYSAFLGTRSCQVSRVDKGWESAYHGSPTLYNPWVMSEDGRWRSRSCTCPKITVGGVFRTREEAARAAFAKQRLDDILDALGVQFPLIPGANH